MLAYFSVTNPLCVLLYTGQDILSHAVVVYDS